MHRAKLASFYQTRFSSRRLHCSYSLDHFSLRPTMTFGLSPFAFSPRSDCNASRKSPVEIPLTHDLIERTASLELGPKLHHFGIGGIR